MSKKTMEEEFFLWLSMKITALQLSDFYLIYPKIDVYGQKIKILNEPLFFTSNLRSLRMLKAFIDTNKTFRSENRGQIIKIQSAMNFYYEFIKEKNELAQKNIENSYSEQERGEECKNKQSVEHSLISFLKDFPTSEKKSFISSENYKRWLLSEKKIVERTADDYSDIIYHCENMAIELGLPEFSLYGTNFEQIVELSHSLQKTSEFKAKDNKFQGEYSVALSYFVQFSKISMEETVTSNTKLDADEQNLGAVEEKHPLDTLDDKIPLPSLRKSEKQNRIVKENSETVLEKTVKMSNFTEEDFGNWLRDQEKLTDATVNAYLREIKNCEKLANEWGLANWKLYNESVKNIQATANTLNCSTVFIELNKVIHNRLSAPLNCFLKFISSEPREPLPERKQTIAQVRPEPKEENPDVFITDSERNKILSVFEIKFPKGFRLNSTIDLKRFINGYNEQNQANYSYQDRDFASKVQFIMCDVGIVHEEMVYPVVCLLNDDVKEEMFQYIQKMFQKGAEIIYYKALFRELDQLLLGQRIYDEKILQAYLRHEYSETFVFQREFFSKENIISVDLQAKLREILLSYHSPVKKEEIYNKLENCPKELLDKHLRAGEFILNGVGEYFHISAFDFSKDELDKMQELIQLTIAERQFLSCSELLDMIRGKYPSVLERFDQYSELGVRNVLANLLGKEFSFQGNIISPFGSQVKKEDVFHDYIKENNAFTLDEVQVLAKDMGVVLNLSTVYGNSLRISKNQFVPREDASFEVDKIDMAISGFCCDNYISLTEITSFSSFPYTGFPWTSFLLEHYVAEFSAEYLLLSLGYSASMCTGAIVKKSSGIKQFDQVLTDVLLKQDVEFSEELALDYLYRSGYLGRRRYSGIGQILSKVKLQKG